MIIAAGSPEYASLSKTRDKRELRDNKYRVERGGWLPTGPDDPALRASLPGFGVASRLAIVLGLLGTTFGIWNNIGVPNNSVSSGRSSPANQAITRGVSALPLELTVTVKRQPIVRRIERKIDPQTLCDVFAVADQPVAWSQSHLFPGEWECISDGSRSGGGPEWAGRQGNPPIFAMIRGRNAKTVDYVRLKISLPPDDGARQARNRFRETAASVVRAMGRELPPKVESSLEAFEPIRLTEDGMGIIFLDEKSSPGRYNLIINLRS